MEEENAKKKRNITIILAIVTIIIYVGIFIIIERDEERTSRLNAEIVTDYSEFYTVSACANKYMSFLASKDSTSLMNVLNEKFKKDNHIDVSNVTQVLPIVSASSTFKIDRMYYEELNDNLYKYYISGYIEVGGLDLTEMNRTKSYMIVYLDKDKTLFSVEPYDGEEYKEGVFE